MTSQAIFISTFIISGLIAYLATLLTIKFAKKFDILDKPTEERKIHGKATPLGGGLPIYLGLLVSVLILWKMDLLLDSRIDASLLVWFFIAGLILVINGLLDDKFSLAAYKSILGPILASVALIYAGLSINTITNPSGGILELNSLFSMGTIMAITFLWLMSITYTTKLLDGIDGLTSTIGLIASLVIFVVSLSWDVADSTTSLLALSLAGSIAGFLILNWHPAKIFLGEGGSTLIGFSLGVLAIISGSKIATALLVMGLPLLDIFWVIIRRARLGRPFWQGDKQHLHFRLLKAGLAQRQIVLFYSAISFAFGLVSIFFTTKAKIGALVILLVLMFILSSWLNIKLGFSDERKV